MRFSKSPAPNLDAEPTQRAPRNFTFRIVAGFLTIAAITSVLFLTLSSCPNLLSLETHPEEHVTTSEIGVLGQKARPRWLLLGYEGDSCGSGSVFSNQGDRSTWCINVPTEPRVPERVNWYPGQYWKLCTWDSANCTGKYSSSLTGQEKCQKAATQSYMIIDAKRDCIGREDD